MPVAARVHVVLRYHHEMPRAGPHDVITSRAAVLLLAADVADAEAAIRVYLEKEGISGVAEQQNALSSQLLNVQGTKRDAEAKRENIARALEPLGSPDTLKARDLFLQKLLTTEAFQRSGIATEEVAHYKQLMQSRADMVAKRVPTSSCPRPAPCGIPIWRELLNRQHYELI